MAIQSQKTISRMQAIASGKQDLGVRSSESKLLRAASKATEQAPGHPFNN